MGKKTYNILFFGTPEFAVPTLQALHALDVVNLAAVITQPDRPAGRHAALIPPPVKQEAEGLHVPILQPESIRTHEFETVVTSYRPDLVVLVAYGKIIPESLLAIPAYGWLNVHASLLPALRGASPIQRAILDGLRETGITVIKLDPGLDTGPILAQQSIPLTGKETFHSLHDTLADLGARVLSTVLPAYLSGNITPKPQPPNGVSVCKPIDKNDGKIDWLKPAVYIERMVRAYTPWPGAFSTWHGSMIKLLSVEALQDTLTMPAGTLHAENGVLKISCGQGHLKVNTIQLAGKRAMDSSEFLSGYGSRLPDQLG